MSSWRPVHHLQGSLGPSGPETPKKSEESLRGLRPRGPPRVWEKSRKSLFGTETLSRPSQTFSRLSGGSRATRPRRLFSEGRDPCKWSTGSQMSSFWDIFSQRDPLSLSFFRPNASNRFSSQQESEGARLHIPDACNMRDRSKKLLSSSLPPGSWSIPADA